MKNRSIRLAILSVAMCITQLGVGLIIPVLPQYLTALGAGGAQAGYLVAAMGVGLLAFSPLAGRWADCYGRKRVMLAGLALFALSQWGMGCAAELWVVYAMRFLGGVGMAGVSTAVTAYVSDCTEVGQRAAGHGRVSAAMTLGIVVGPGVGGLLASYDMRLPFFFAAFVSGAAILACAALLPESLNRQVLQAAKKHSDEKKIGLMQAYRGMRTSYGPLLLFLFVMTFALAGMEAVFGLYVSQKHGLDAQQIAVLITSGALLGALVQAMLLKRLLSFLSEEQLLGGSMTTAALTLLGMLTVNSFAGLLLLNLLFFAALSTLRPAINTLLSKMCDREQGFLAGLNQAYTGLGIILGPAIGGILFDVHIDLPFFCSALTMLGSLLFLSRRAERNIGELTMERVNTKG